LILPAVLISLARISLKTQRPLSCNNCKDKDNDGYSTCDGDCNDRNTEEGFNTNPGIEEKCRSGEDDNCNGSADESPCCDGSDEDGDQVSKCDGDCDDTHPDVQFDCDACAERLGGQAEFERQKAECVNTGGRIWLPAPACRCSDLDPSPILIDLANDNFSLTSLSGGVRFDLNGDGRAEQLPWTSAAGNDAWLALDRNGDGRITTGRELFGSYTEQPASAEPNGFIALGLLDSNGDGRVTSADERFAALLLWVDANHDGVSQPTELYPLGARGISSISTVYKKRDEGIGTVTNFAIRVRQ
jgi:hypothetical protein